MDDNRIVVYKLFADTEGFLAPEPLSEGYRMEIWRPSYRSIIPHGKSMKYVLYWFFYFLGIFRNRDYAAVFLYDRDQIISSLLVVPTYYKWPFMQPNDLQFAYVMTRNDYRGKGLAETTLRMALGHFSKAGRDFWYVTDTGNNASMALCAKIGFSRVGYAKRSYLLKRLKLL